MHGHHVLSGVALLSWGRAFVLAVLIVVAWSNCLCFWSLVFVLGDVSACPRVFDFCTRRGDEFGEGRRKR